MLQHSLGGLLDLLCRGGHSVKANEAEEGDRGAIEHLLPLLRLVVREKRVEAVSGREKDRVDLGVRDMYVNGSGA